jgi:hypothetical protein
MQHLDKMPLLVVIMGMVVGIAVGAPASSPPPNNLLLLQMGMGHLLDAPPPPDVDVDDTVVTKKGNLTKPSLYNTELSRLPKILPMQVRSEVWPTVGVVGVM